MPVTVAKPACGSCGVWLSPGAQHAPLPAMPLVPCLAPLLSQVAALGLDPHKHLGRSIRQLQPYLHKLRDRFGCNVCGEGGEYETLTLDCPAFTRGRIVLDSWEVRGPGVVQCCGLRGGAGAP